MQLPPNRSETAREPAPNAPSPQKTTTPARHAADAHDPAPGAQPLDLRQSTLDLSHYSLRFDRARPTRACAAPNAPGTGAKIRRPGPAPAALITECRSGRTPPEGKAPWRPGLVAPTGPLTRAATTSPLTDRRRSASPNVRPYHLRTRPPDHEITCRRQRRRGKSSVSAALVTPHPRLPLHVLMSAEAHRGEDPDRALALAHTPVQLQERAKPSDKSRVRALERDQQLVSERVASQAVRRATRTRRLQPWVLSSSRAARSMRSRRQRSLGARIRIAFSPLRTQRSSCEERPEARDVGRVRALHRDQQLVSERVASEAVRGADAHPSLQPSVLSSSRAACSRRSRSAARRSARSVSVSGVPMAASFRFAVPEEGPIPAPAARRRRAMLGSAVGPSQPGAIPRSPPARRRLAGVALAVCGRVRLL